MVVFSPPSSWMSLSYGPPRRPQKCIIRRPSLTSKRSRLTADTRSDQFFFLLLAFNREHDATTRDKGWTLRSDRPGCRFRRYPPPISSWCCSTCLLTTRLSRAHRDSRNEDSQGGVLDGHLDLFSLACYQHILSHHTQQETESPRSDTNN